MKTILTIAAAAITTAAIGEDRPQDRWNLADLYPTVEAWSADAQTVEARSADVAACKGHLGDSAKRMLECLELQSDVLKRYFRLAVYANELYAEDTGQSSSLSLRQRSQVLGSKLTEAASFVSPEVLQIGPEKVQSFLKEEKGLAVYRHSLDDILRMAPHTLDLAGEALIASFQLAAGQSSSVYTSFANSDMPWPTVKLSDGQEVRLDQAAYTKYRDVANRDDRKLVMDSFFGKFKEFERTMGVAFYGSLKEDTVYTRVRKYPDTMTRALDRNRVPRAVYDALIKATNDNLPTLHRYFRLRTKMLGIPAGEMRYYDIYPPLVPSGRKYPVDEAVQMMLAAVRPLGDEYVAALKKAVDSRWMDVYPRPKKLSGAHMAGYAYDVHPYVLLNHNDNYESVSTLAHEWGHAMHSYFSNKTQPFPTARYAIFVAEIASTTNEALLLDYALKTAKNDDERLLYLGSALEELRGTFFRQAMFGEFELNTHDAAAKGEALNGKRMTEIYCKLLKDYHGDAAGVMKIDPLYCQEWAFIPHFYRPFYVYQYATSITAA
ncbi:MAG: oligoendopeptidase F family protein, partial [Betaproteobacteria bacterium]|nr:oligoendopeptidase F family protein [Betaproteobacteria bacterium]